VWGTYSLLLPAASNTTSSTDHRKIINSRSWRSCRNLLLLLLLL
jgi:hypothetical protein